MKWRHSLAMPFAMFLTLTLFVAISTGPANGQASIRRGWNAVSGLLSFTTRPTVTVNGATTFAVTASYMVLACTGAETINTITGGSTGTLVLVENSDTECTIADDDDATAADAIDLTGTATNDTGAVAKVITLLYNGTHWLQTSESDN